MDETRVQQEAGLAMCAETCSGPGHRVHPIQATVAAAAPSSWRDALVTPSADGDVVVATLEGATVRLWHHLPLDLVAGEPVAYHPVAGVLAARGAVLSVRALS